MIVLFWHIGDSGRISAWGRTAAIEGADFGAALTPELAEQEDRTREEMAGR